MSAHKHRSMPQKKNRQAAESGPVRIPMACLWGVLTFLAGSLLLTLLFSAICLRLSDPDAVLLPFSLVCLYLSALMGGFMAMKKSGTAAIPTGLLSGLAMLALTLLVAVLLPKGTSGLSFGVSFLLRLLILLFSTLGSLLALNLGKPRRRR